MSFIIRIFYFCCTSCQFLPSVKSCLLPYIFYGRILYCVKSNPLEEVVPHAKLVQQALSFNAAIIRGLLSSGYLKSIHVPAWPSSLFLFLKWSLVFFFFPLEKCTSQINSC